MNNRISDISIKYLHVREYNGSLYDYIINNLSARCIYYINAILWTLTDSPIYDSTEQKSYTIVVEYIDQYRITVKISDMNTFDGSNTHFGNSFNGLGTIKWS